MRELTTSLAQKLILKKTQSKIARNYILSREEISSPFDTPIEYSNRLYAHLIKEVISDISDEYFLPEDILSEYFEFIDWEPVLHTQIVSEEWIHDFREEIDWMLVCKYQILSEAFIDKHKKYLSGACWKIIWQTQRLSEEFIEKHKDKLPRFI